jgi:hypothetical protein
MEKLFDDVVMAAQPDESLLEGWGADARRAYSVALVAISAAQQATAGRLERWEDVLGPLNDAKSALALVSVKPQALLLLEQALCSLHMSLAHVLLRPPRTEMLPTVAAPTVFFN